MNRIGAVRTLTVRSESVIRAMVEVAIARFQSFQALRSELVETRSALEERKVVERAKGLIMEHQNCPEEEAFRNLRKLAMDRNQRLGQVFGLVAPGYTMAKTVSAHLNGDNGAAFTGADMSTKLKLLGVDVGSIGDAHAATANICSRHNVTKGDICCAIDEGVTVPAFRARINGDRVELQLSQGAVDRVAA